MTRFELVIAGGGLTAARAIKSYREAGGDGQIAVLTNESVLPYHRPALSKRYLRGETGAPFAEDEAFYRDHDVEVLLETAVTAVDLGARTVTTDSGEFAYGKLLLATGATPRRLEVPGAEIAGVYALRTLQDSGVVVNERFETNAEGVYAAGDVANFFDRLYGRQRRIEHWSNANYQGTEVGKILAGAGDGYNTVSSFFSEVFGTTIKVFGNTSQAVQLAAEGSIESAFLASYGDRGRLVGAISVGQNEEIETLVKDLIAERAPTDALARDLVGGRL